MQQENLTSEERLMAMLSHLSLLFGGIVLPIIFWATQKDKSRFIRYHALQSIFFQIAYIVILVILIVALSLLAIFFGVGLGILTATASSDPDAFPLLLVLFIILFYAAVIISAFGLMGYSIYLAVKSYQGSYIKVPIIGNIIYKKVYGS